MLCILRSCKLDVSPYCLVCGSKGETGEHVVFVRKKAQSVWRIILPSCKTLLNNKSWVEWFLMCFGFWVVLVVGVLYLGD